VLAAVGVSATVAIVGDGAALKDLPLDACDILFDMRCDGR
jgi:hypothetical protein